MADSAGRPREAPASTPFWVEILTLASLLTIALVLFIAVGWLAALIVPALVLTDRFGLRARMVAWLPVLGTIAPGVLALALLVSIGGLWGGLIVSASAGGRTTSTPMPTALAVVVASPTSRPSATPAVTPLSLAAIPTATPIETPTPLPSTSTPSSTDTPLPTVTPTITITPTMTPYTWPTPEFATMAPEIPTITATPTPETPTPAMMATKAPATATRKPAATVTKRPAPTATKKPSYPAGATAICKDGTYSYSQHRRGTCSHHGGVKKWLANLPP